MKLIASAIVVLSGCVLWASGMFAVTLTNMHQGNLRAGETATWGGIGVTALGVVLLLVTILSSRDGRDR